MHSFWYWSPNTIFNNNIINNNNYQGGRLLKEKCRLELQVERNLEGDLSHSVPDFCVDGTLSSVHASIDVNQYKLVKGLLEHNFGESLEEFQRPMMAHLQDPKNVVSYVEKTWEHKS